MRRTILVLFAVPLLMAADCGGDQVAGLVGGLADNKDVQVTLSNTDGQPVHLFLHGEDFPCCQVASGGTRTVTVLMTPGGSVTFWAGRNGETLTTRTCTLTDTGWNSAHATVTFSGGGLTCSGW